MHTRLLVIATGLMTFMLMLALEATKELIFHSDLETWHSHWITITFTSLAAMVICFLFFSRLDQMQLKRHESKIREEKLRILELVMFKVNHHVNNLANNLQLIELENNSGKISDLTIQELRESIQETCREMRRLSTATDPDNPELFSIIFPEIDEDEPKIIKHHDNKLQPAACKK